MQAVLNQYCVTCHNAQVKAGSLELQDKDLSQLQAHPAVWESVVRKLRTGMMPPASARRPERATLDGVAAWLEAGLDRAAARAPNPGSPSLHRMNRHEYANAVRDLLDLEVDVTALLPSDSTVAGFDNIADVLGTSPALAQSYVSAAMKISRLAVGDLTAPPLPVTHAAPAGASQSAHVDGLPLGTQGGMVVRHTFPVDAEYRDPGRGRRPRRHHYRRHAHPRRPRSHPDPRRTADDPRRDRCRLRHRADGRDFQRACRARARHEHHDHRTVPARQVPETRRAGAGSSSAGLPPPIRKRACARTIVQTLARARVPAARARLTIRRCRR